MRFENTRIVLTGAASGIGAATLALLCQRPCHVLAVDRDEAGLRQTIAGLRGSHGHVSLFVADLGQPDQVEAMFEHALAQLGGD